MNHGYKKYRGISLTEVTHHRAAHTGQSGVTNYCNGLQRRQIVAQVTATDQFNTYGP